MVAIAICHQVHYYHDDQLREIVTETGVPAPDPPTKLADLNLDEWPKMPRLGAPPAHLVPSAHVPTLPPPLRPSHHKLPVKEHMHPSPGHRCGEYGYLPSANRLKLFLELAPKQAEAVEAEGVRQSEHGPRLLPGATVGVESTLLTLAWVVRRPAKRRCSIPG